MNDAHVVHAGSTEVPTQEECMSYDETDDPFGGESLPSISWKDVPPGTIVSGSVIAAPKLVQGRDFETGNPATWPDGKPKMVAVINVETGEGPRSLWAQKPSALFVAIQEAQRQAGARIAVGGVIAVKYTHDVPNQNPRLNPAKQFAAKYTPPAEDPFAQQHAVQDTPPAAAADPWNTTPPRQQYTPPRQATPTEPPF